MKDLSKIAQSSHTDIEVELGALWMDGSVNYCKTLMHKSDANLITSFAVIYGSQAETNKVWDWLV